MPLKGTDTHADRHWNELEGEETVKQVHHSGAHGEDANDDGELGLVEEDGDEDAESE